jgi:hypothetical protein
VASAHQVWEIGRIALADRDGCIAVLKAYIDESGIHDNSPVLTVATYLARQNVWRDWTKKWNLAKKPIKVYHAADAANLQGEFEDWTDDEVAELAKKLLPVIGTAELAGMVIGIHMDEYRKAMIAHPDLAIMLGEPYSACFQWLVSQTIHIANELKSDERIAFIHEINDFQGEATQTFGWVRNEINMGNRIVSLTFGSKETYTPLQAADILAYEGNKRFRDPDRPPRRAWTALDPKDKIIQGHFGKHNMDRLISDLYGVRSRLLEAGWDGKENPT